MAVPTAKKWMSYRPCELRAIRNNTRRGIQRDDALSEKMASKDSAIANSPAQVDKYGRLRWDCFPPDGSLEWICRCSCTTVGLCDMLYFSSR